MAGILPDIMHAVGSTPLVRLNTIGRGLPGAIAAKIESMNPLGSVKDRIGAAMIQAAEAQGLITPGDSSSSPPAATPALPWPLSRQPRNTGSSSPCRKP